MKGAIQNEFDPNLKLYSSGAIASHYTHQEGLFPAERAILVRVLPQCSDRPVLDVGVGAGRTTPHLLKLSSDYLGIDYSPEMIEQCRQRFPGVHFEHADARKLDDYPEGHFACILFSNNGMDYVSHEDRLLILKQFRRLLAKDGLFAFSAHNRLVRFVSPFNLKRFLTINPLKFIWRVGLYVIGITRYLRLHKHQCDERDYSIRVDGYFNYSFVTYYISASDQARQLRAAGFDLLAVYSASGEEITEQSQDTSPWLYYLARKNS